jgi:propanol-preferring alcohol dehydrogenase
MKALRYAGERQAEVQDRPDPHPGPGEVVVKMKAAGICGSDLHAYRHPRQDVVETGRVPGHEPCGVVHEFGAGVTGWKVGDRVAVWFRQTCGECFYCKTGRANVCVNRGGSYGVGPGTADGAHAEYMRCRAANLMALPEDFSFEDGAIVACQGGTAYYPLSRLDVSGRDVLVVSGLGPVGQLATLFASHMGATVIGVDPSPERRAWAEELGAWKTLDPMAGKLGEAVFALVPGGADKLIETSGSNAAHMVIGDVLKPLGTAAIVGLGTPEFKMPLSALTMRELNLFGTSIFPDFQYDEIWAFMRRHGIKPSRVISHRFPLEQGAEAFRLADSATAGKVCFTFA